jgi:hypothetical protein
VRVARAMKLPLLTGLLRLVVIRARRASRRIQAGVGPTCGSGERAQGRGGAGPRPATGGRAGGERNRGGEMRKGEKKLTRGPWLVEGERERREGEARAGAEGLRELGLGRVLGRVERRERREGRTLGLGSWAGMSHAGEKGGRGEWAAGERAGPRGREGRRAGRAAGWALFPLSSSFLFLFYTQTIQTKLFEFQ